MTDFAVVIPARFASQRLPGKPLVVIAGKPMIEQVWERACESRAGEVVIATDDNRIWAALCNAIKTVGPTGKERLLWFEDFLVKDRPRNHGPGSGNHDVAIAKEPQPFEQCL